MLLKKETQSNISVIETEPGKFSAGFIMIGVPAGELPVTPVGPDKDHPEKSENLTDANGKKFDITAIYAVWTLNVIDIIMYVQYIRLSECRPYFGSAWE